MYDLPTATHSTLYMKDFRKAFNLAKESSKCTQVPEMNSESNYLMGRIHHAQGRYSDAYFYYSEVRVYSVFIYVPFYMRGVVCLLGAASITPAKKKNLLTFPTCAAIFLGMQAMEGVRSSSVRKSTAITS